MNEIEYKLESSDPVLISHAISKLFDSIKKKRSCQDTDHISKLPEFKLLLTKQDSSDATLSISACQALIALVENGLWDISDALSTFSSSLSSIKNCVVAATAIGRLLLLDMKYSGENRAIYPFTLHAPQHPFIMILNRDEHSWRFVLNEMTSIVNHRDPQIRESSVEILRPVFLYILCNPSLNSLECCAQPFCWQLLIKSKHSACLQTEILLWMCTAETFTCININYRILEFAEKAMLEKDKQLCTALSLMIASLTIQLLKHGSDPKSNFQAISTIIDECDTRIGNIMLALMAEIITLCPTIYMHSALQICTMIIKKMLCTDIFLNTLMACVLKWMAYPSILCSDALDMATDLTKKVFTKAMYTENDDTVFSSQIFAAVTYSDCNIEFYWEMVHSLSSWKSNDILLWLKSMSRVPTDLKDKCKLLLCGLLLQSNDPQVTELSCKILVDVSKERKSFESHVLSLVLHKLAKSRNSTESKCLLMVLPELVTMKENVPIVAHTLDTLLNGDQQLKYFAIELYLKTLRKEPRCYRFVSTAIIRLMKSDRCWYSDATCARAIKYICENHCEHGESLVPLLSQILNRSTETNGGTASALALQSISALCKASVIDISSTWRILAPKMEKEKRIIVLESLCQLFGDITAYPASSGSVEEHDKLIDDIISNLWKYTIHSDPRIIDAALGALARYSLDNIPLKALPADFRCNLSLPAAYAKTPIDADKKPEDVLPYIPGTCWIQMLQKVNKMAISAAGDLLISFVNNELNSFPSRIYVWPQGEPQNFKYLPEKSVIRAVGEHLRRCNKSDYNNHRIITECLRILAHKYPKPLPNINWCFLKDTVDLSPEAKEYTLSIASHHSTISLSAKTFVENYLLAYKSITDSDLTLKQNEYRVFYSNLEDFCRALQPNTIKPFLETTLEYVIKKITVDDDENSINLFQHIMSAYARTLQNQQVHDGNSTLLATILEKLLDKIDLTCDHFGSYFVAALELSPKHLERMTSPKVWWEITSSKLKNAVAIRAEMALKERSEFPLSWLNEIIDETTSIPSVQTYLLGVIKKLQAAIQFERSVVNWTIEIMTQIQGILVEPSQQHCYKAQFYCNILLVSVISLSGTDCMSMKEDLLTTSHNVRVQLFPLALAVLSVRQDWKHVIPQVMEWLNYMRTSTISNVYKFMFHRSLIYLKHNPYYKDVWTKYISIKTEIDIRT